jgi:hypothetical protein
MRFRIEEDLMDDVGGFLEIGTNGRGEVVINHPQLVVDAAGVGHLVFSPNQAMNLARLLIKHADQARREAEQARGTIKKS